MLTSLWWISTARLEWKTQNPSQWGKRLLFSVFGGKRIYNFWWWEKVIWKDCEGVLYNYQHGLWRTTQKCYACGCSEWGIEYQMESETDGRNRFVVKVWVTWLNLNALVSGIGATNAEQADALDWMPKECWGRMFRPAPLTRPDSTSLRWFTHHSWPPIKTKLVFS